MNFKNIICVTNRHLLLPSLPPAVLSSLSDGSTENAADGRTGLLRQLSWLADTDADGIVLREKDMSEEDYTRLAKAAIDICAQRDKRLILHTFIGTAIRLHHPHIHLPLSALKEASAKGGLSSDGHAFITVGVSVHSVDEAILAERLGATYLVAGHIFATDCKRGVPPRGTEFLRTITASVHIPVYAIGGISMQNLPEVLACGAVGGCMMSGAMRLPQGHN